MTRADLAIDTCAKMFFNLHIAFVIRTLSSSYPNSPSTSGSSAGEQSRKLTRVNISLTMCFKIYLNMEMSGENNI